MPVGLAVSNMKRSHVVMSPACDAAFGDGGIDPDTSVHEWPSRGKRGGGDVDDAIQSDSDDEDKLFLSMPLTGGTPSTPRQHPPSHRRGKHTLGGGRAGPGTGGSNKSGGDRSSAGSSARRSGAQQWRRSKQPRVSVGGILDTTGTTPRASTAMTPAAAFPMRDHGLSAVPFPSLDHSAEHHQHHEANALEDDLTASGEDAIEDDSEGDAFDRALVDATQGLVCLNDNKEDDDEDDEDEEVEGSMVDQSLQHPGGNDTDHLPARQPSPRQGKRRRVVASVPVVDVDDFGSDSDSAGEPLSPVTQARTCRPAAAVVQTPTHGTQHHSRAGATPGSAEPPDSARKLRKPLSNGLAERLQKLLRFQLSEWSVRDHRHTSGATPLGIGTARQSFFARVVRVSTTKESGTACSFGTKVLGCVLDDAGQAGENTRVDLWVPPDTASRLNASPGSHVRVEAPWQRLSTDWCAGRAVVVAPFCFRSEQSSPQAQTDPEVLASLSQLRLEARVLPACSQAPPRGLLTETQATAAPGHLAQVTGRVQRVVCHDEEQPLTSGGLSTKLAGLVARARVSHSLVIQSAAPDAVLLVDIPKRVAESQPWTLVLKHLKEHVGTIIRIDGLLPQTHLTCRGRQVVGLVEWLAPTAWVGDAVADGDTTAVVLSSSSQAADGLPAYQPPNPYPWVAPGGMTVLRGCVRARLVHFCPSQQQVVVLPILKGSAAAQEPLTLSVPPAEMDRCRAQLHKSWESIVCFEDVLVHVDDDEVRVVFDAASQARRTSKSCSSKAYQDIMAHATGFVQVGGPVHFVVDQDPQASLVERPCIRVLIPRSVEEHNAQQTEYHDCQLQPATLDELFPKAKGLKTEAWVRWMTSQLPKQTLPRLLCHACDRNCEGTTDFVHDVRVRL
eukprot:m.346508 g.346508  ORF g.346508 m.346508 type:complete len:896 (-) comp19862_c0_seq17:1227-3914(-)